MTRRPRIGLTLDLDERAGRYELKRSYADAVLAAGGLPVLIAYGDASAAGAYLALCDGLVVTGGDFDIAPERYGEEPRAGCGPSKPERTLFESGLVEAALSARLPLLGICAGMQLLNVVRGGTLYQHLPDDLSLSHEQPPPKDRPSHEVDVAAGTLLARLVGAGPLDVNSTHHQAVRRPGTGVLVSGRARDGVVEAIELPDLPFALGVQWHPEACAAHEARHGAIFRGLVDAAGDLRR
ncbi:MAG TPA: gamma-glutamyl-gamma-aminobutyrate hydrolase family protein [Anaeromyxobacteraceae bacterium]|jgi:putative glutamine amidotransferase|nr:gamma-glutamyl-gamma-aminobutyrate hydrolase family protein [Anaeromyxobacteraceae bacterium]